MKKVLVISIFVSFFVLSIFMPFAMAHAPLGTLDNESIDKATVIPDPTKSWAIYSALNKDGDAQYYTFNINAGQQIHVSLFKSIRSDEAGFSPELAILGLGITRQGSVPVQITVPKSYSVLIVASKEPTASYEPFSPSSFYSLSDEIIDAPTTGTYYIVVYSQPNTPPGGHYGLAIGDRETYTLDEWILIPFNLMNIYQWESQSLAQVLAPMIVTLIVGIILVAWLLKKHLMLANVMAWFGALSSLTFIGTGFTTLYQMLWALMLTSLVPEASITLIFAVIPLILGVLTLRLSIKNSKHANIRKRIYFIILGVAALFIWAGLLVGPVMAILASIIPTRFRKTMM